jgi:hypothetical protein
MKDVGGWEFLAIEQEKGKSASDARPSTLLYACCRHSNLNSNYYCADVDLYGVTCLLGKWTVTS